MPLAPIERASRVTDGHSRRADEGPLQLERGITGESFGAHITRQRLEALSRMVDAGQLHAEVEAVLPLERAREALERVAGGHTRGKVVVQIRK
jgi:NADPH:quinone reductase